MFEDANQKNQNSASQNPGPGPFGADGAVFNPAPGNAVNPPAAGGPAKPPVEDIFSQMDPRGKPSRPAILGPKGAGQPGEPADHGSMDVFKKSMDARRMIIAGLGLGGLVLIFIGAWYSYNIFLPAKQESKVNNPADTTGQVRDSQADNGVTPANTANSGNTEAQPAENAATSENPVEENGTGAESSGQLFGTDLLVNQPGSGNSESLNGTTTESETGTEPAAAAMDSDNDGLTDAEEAQLGTDPNKMDSDGDGLFDKEEVEIYKTDPLNSDTDGDSYADGSEVKSGYDPKGPGKLFEVIPTP